MAAESKNMCMDTAPWGPLKRRGPEPFREAPPLDSLGWMKESHQQAGQRPWVHFAVVEGSTPYCRSTQFKRDPVQQGIGVRSTAAMGERPCPRYVARMGKAGDSVMAEFFEERP